VLDRQSADDAGPQTIQVRTCPPDNATRLRLTLGQGGSKIILKYAGKDAT
jgi:hypothetical protein